MQLLYIANRYEWKPAIERGLAAGHIVICDRYLASSVAYGEAQGLDAGWLIEIQRFLPQPDLTVAARHRAGDGGRPQGGRTATGSSGTWRCCDGCATAIGARRDSRAGS